MTESNIPEGSVLRDDGCICPADAPPPPPPEAEEKCKLELVTCPYDPRFPNQNQTKRCYFSFIDYQRCARLLGDYPGCKYFLTCYRSLCPVEWQEKWFEQMEKGTFARKIYPPKPIIRPKPDTCSPDFEQEPPPGDVSATSSILLSQYAHHVDPSARRWCKYLLEMTARE